MEWRLQGISTVAKLGIGDDGLRQPIESDGHCGYGRPGCEMDGLDGDRAFVHEIKRAADLDFPTLGIDLNTQLGAGELRLRSEPVSCIAPLVLGAPGLIIRGRLMRIEDVRVV